MKKKIIGMITLAAMCGMLYTSCAAKHHVPSPPPGAPAPPPPPSK